MADSADTVVSTEPLARILPALSATSDAPKVEAIVVAEPVVADNTEAVKVTSENDAAASAQPEAVESEDVDAAENTEKPAKKELEPWAKREITKARNQKREADAARTASETRAAASEANLRKALEAVEKLTGDSAMAARKSVDASDPRPQRDTFDNPDAYDSALVEWAGRRAALAATASVEAKLEADRVKQTKADQEAAAESTFRELTATYQKRVEEFSKDHPDYEDVAGNEEVSISNAMSAVILNDEDGPAIAYYLGQNPDEAERISKLSPARVGSELGRIAAKLNAKPIVSTKPKPITPLRTSGITPASARKTPNEMSMEEYAAYRKSGMNGAGASH